MNQIFEWKTGNPYPLGANVVGEYINFAVSLNPRKECGIILYGEKGKEINWQVTKRIWMQIFCLIIFIVMRRSS